MLMAKPSAAPAPGATPSAHLPLSAIVRCLAQLCDLRLDPTWICPDEWDNAAWQELAEAYFALRAISSGTWEARP